MEGYSSMTGGGQPSPVFQRRDGDTPHMSRRNSQEEGRDTRPSDDEADLLPRGTVSQRWSNYQQQRPGRAKALKYSLIALVILAVLGAVFVTSVMLTGGFSHFSHFMTNTALPAVKSFMAKHITVAEAFGYIVAPIVGLAALTGLGYKYVPRMVHASRESYRSWLQKEEG